ncbi:MAG: hypothetical protein KBF57_13890 [Saprospiraceae bacterium]|nr:hypothetical protein [Saprospiraceae bacterium]
MDIYNLANIIIPCITLGVSFFTPGVSSECDRMFRIVLIITAVIELLGALFQNEFLVSNNIVYNIYILALFLSYFYLYFLLNKKSLFRGLFNAVLFIMVWITEWFYLQTISDAYFFFAYTAGSLLLLSNVYVYIMDRLNSSDVADIERSRYFWISIGILVFYIPFLPVFLGVKYALIDFLVFRGIVLLLQLLMHTSNIIGIRWGSRI